ncbi:hypothetical protein QYE76_040308 [Lolium multiflorum]|uniref:Ionotropic glutamate receptor C-terminal domain-containing protein n=1 Tax=Lolium multiflorum TaxID=4521 RepID=A0AAD8TAY2_LOLMU|nr:hypothetical protein QYE76_040308 [Lolium multiflorum]
MEWTTRRLLVFLSSLTLWSISVDVCSPAAAGPVLAPAPAPVRIGVVLDLTSDVGKKTRACISKALDDFDAAHGTARVELRVIDSRGDLAVAAHAAGDLIRNDQVQAMIWGPQTPSKADQVAHLGHSNNIPVLSFSDISPTSCAFWLEDPLTVSGGHAKVGFTLGSDSIAFLTPTTDKRNGIKLDTIKTSEDCQGPYMKIGVPLKHGFKEFVQATDPNPMNHNFTGYSIDIFKAAMRDVNPSPCYQFWLFQGTYDELVGNVSSGVRLDPTHFQLILSRELVGDVTITAKRAAATDFTVPYTQSGVSMLVLVKYESHTWTFLSLELWIATVVFIIYTGFVVCMIELQGNPEYQGSISRQCSNALYFVFSTLTFSHGQGIRSPLSKIVVVVWCFVVLILVTSYTASLSSMNHDDREKTYSSGDRSGPAPAESKLMKYTTKEEYAAALRKGSKNGGVSAIVDEIPYLTSFLSDGRNKNEFMMLGCIYKTPGFGFAFRLGSPLVHDLSSAILNLAEGTGSSAIEAEWFGTAAPLMGSGTVPDTDFADLTFRSFSGLFFITGSISTLMLLISIVRLVHAKYTRVRQDDVESVPDSIVDETSPLQDGMGGNPSPHQQPPHEAVSNDIEDVHVDVSDENAGGGEPGPLQLNDTHTGPMPAAHIQIDMSNV